MEERQQRLKAADSSADTAWAAALRKQQESPSRSAERTDWAAEGGIVSRPAAVALETGDSSLALESSESVASEQISTEQPVVALPTGHAIAKRLFDLVGAIAIAVVIAPVFAAIAIKIRLSGAPVIFSHMRVGKDRQMFPCYKFRSMIPDAEKALQELLRSSPEILREWRESHKLKNDPRVTRFGKFLRESSLDELPQLWNVIKGEMSLVGPRPIVADELERYGGKAQTYYSVKPGMTGLWQIMGRSSVTYSRRVSMDALYVRKQSTPLDIWILLRTAVVVLRRIGAH